MKVEINGRDYKTREDIIANLMDFKHKLENGEVETDEDIKEFADERWYKMKKNKMNDDEQAYDLFSKSLFVLIVVTILTLIILLITGSTPSLEFFESIFIVLFFGFILMLFGIAIRELIKIFLNKQKKS